ncbi:MAG: hypothetical protein WD225_04965 [Ilumatobacteraceae bacterium]
MLPVVDRLASILPDGGLVRGRTVACVGPAAPTVALTLVARATAEGSWLAVVGLPWLGVEAARELGVALERVVAVDVDPRHHPDWAECVAAAVVGFEVVLAAPSRSMSDRLWRQVRARLQARGGVLVTLPTPSGPTPSAPVPSADLVVTASTEAWEGIGRGHGHLSGRRLRLTVTGRRTPHPRTAVLPANPPPANPVLTTSAFAG